MRCDKLVSVNSRSVWQWRLCTQARPSDNLSTADWRQSRLSSLWQSLGTDWLSRYRVIIYFIISFQELSHSAQDRLKWRQIVEEASDSNERLTFSSINHAWIASCWVAPLPFFSIYSGTLSSWNKPKLFISSLTPSHRVFLSGPFCLKPGFHYPS